MEMRKPRLGARYYIPWDSLQLSERIDSGKRITKHDIEIPLFRLGYRRQKLAWVGSWDNHVLYFNPVREERYEFIEYLVTFTEKHWRGQFDFAFYDFDGTWNTEMLAMDDKYYNMTYHPFEESFEHFLDSILKHNAVIDDNLAKAPIKRIEPANKELQVLIVDLTIEQLKEINSDYTLISKLKNVLRKCIKNRIYLLLMTEEARLFPRELLPHHELTDFSHILFMHDVNWRWARDVGYPRWPVRHNDRKQRVIGYGISEKKPGLIPLHSLKYTMSDQAARNKEKKENVEALYREFLASLDDGSSLE